MDRGSDFECEFRARRIRVRGTPHTNRFTICHEIIVRYSEVYACEMHACEVHAYETHTYEVCAHDAYKLHAHEMNA